MIAVGTGAALRMAASGDADVVLVHAPAAERPYVEAGDLVDGRGVMHNDFVIVGPSEDPAGIRALTSITDVMRAIAARGIFVSRGDDSGTHTQELALVGGGADRSAVAQPTRRDRTGDGRDAERRRPEARLHARPIVARTSSLRQRLGLVVLFQGDATPPQRVSRLRREPGQAPAASSTPRRGRSSTSSCPRRSSGRSPPSSATSTASRSSFRMRSRGQSIRRSNRRRSVGDAVRRRRGRARDRAADAPRVRRSHGPGRARRRSARIRHRAQELPRAHDPARIHQHRHGHAAGRRRPRRLAAARAERSVRRPRPHLHAPRDGARPVPDRHADRRRIHDRIVPGAAAASAGSAGRSRRRAACERCGSWRGKPGSGCSSRSWPPSARSCPRSARR